MRATSRWPGSASLRAFWAGAGGSPEGSSGLGAELGAAIRSYSSYSGYSSYPTRSSITSVPAKRSCSAWRSGWSQIAQR